MYFEYIEYTASELSFQHEPSEENVGVWEKASKTIYTTGDDNRKEENSMLALRTHRESLLGECCFSESQDEVEIRGGSSTTPNPKILPVNIRL